MGNPTSRSPLDGPAPGERLDSWKEIAAYLNRDVTTVQRWEKREAMPVHRHVHDKLGSVYAYRNELDAWMRQRNPVPASADPGPTARRDEAQAGPAESAAAPTAEAWSPAAPIVPPRRARWLGLLAGGVIVVVVAAGLWLTRPPETPWLSPLDGARSQIVTDFDGVEQAAAVSPDGRLVAFTSDRDGQMDVWVTRIGTGQFHNLTRGRVKALVNPSVRTLGFSPDGAQVTFWARGVDGANADDIGVWMVPTLGGPPTPYLEGVAEFSWSADGARLAYHTPGPGDPMFVGDPLAGARGAPIFTAPTGLHAHFPTWSPDGAFLYFVQGTVPNAMDLWRIRPTGEGAERLTRHDAAVSHPVFVSARTVLYLVGDGDTSGSRMYALDVDTGTARPLGTGLDRYSSLAASADGRRVVATLASPKGTLWRVPLGDAPASVSDATRVVLPTSRVSSPRLGPGYLLYVSAKGTGDGIWKLVDETATELWSASEARVVGGPEIAPDGRRVAFSAEQGGRTLLYVMNADGTDARVVCDSLQLRGAPAWAPDGQSLTSGADVGGTPRLFSIPLDGPPVKLSEDFAVDPVWSPDGDFVVYSGADVGTEFPVKAVTPDGTAYPLPPLSLTRGARRMQFFQGRRALALMRGELRHRNLWLIDLEAGRERLLTNLPPDFDVRDFDLAADGRALVVERMHELSDVVLFDLPSRD